MDQPLPAVKIWSRYLLKWLDLQGGFGRLPSNFGPEVSFGHRLSEELPGDLRIVKVAQGGTDLAEDWSPYAPLSGWQMYPLLTTDVQEATANLEAAGHSVKVAGMMWAQGAADARLQTKANAYEDNLTAFIAQVRSDFAAPDMPFIIARTHDEPFDDFPYMATVRAAQVNVAETDENADWIDTDTLGLRDDNMHFDTNGTIDLGHAFAETYLQLAERFRINAGLNDAWYDPMTDGQGFFITVFPDMGRVTLAWFTYDTELPDPEAVANLGDPGHRWLTAIGKIQGNQAVMRIVFTRNGIFDTPTKVQRTDPPWSDGQLVLTFDDCNSGTVEYDIPSIGRTAIVPIQRVAEDNIALCEALGAE
jgi:hypothetical protein